MSDTPQVDAVVENSKEKKKEELSLDYVMPYPIPINGKCEVCGREFSKHSHMDFFLEPAHVRYIRDFWETLREKHDKAEPLFLNMAINAGESVWSPKNIMDKLLEIAQSDPALANRVPFLVSHYIPSEKFKFKTQVAIGPKLFAVLAHFDGFVLKWECDFLQHVRFQVSSKEVEKKNERTLLAKAVGSDPVYVGFVSTHENEAELDYKLVQKEFHSVVPIVCANLTIADEFFKSRFGNMIAAIKSRNDKPSIVKSDSKK
jgi:hypothetical protein